MATGALFVDRRRRPRYQARRAVRVNRMTRRAGDLTFGMAALKASAVRLLIQMALQAGLVHRGGRKLGRISDLLRRSGFGVLAPRAVAGFARLTVPSPLLIRFDDLMRALPDRVEDIFVAGLAHL